MDQEAQERMKTMRGGDENGEGMDIESEIGTEKGAGEREGSDQEKPESHDEREGSESGDRDGEDEFNGFEEEDEDEEALRDMPTLVDIQKAAVAEAHRMEVQTDTFKEAPTPTIITP